jgi:hypothetical protein
VIAVAVAVAIACHRDAFMVGRDVFPIGAVAGQPIPHRDHRLALRTFPDRLALQTFPDWLALRTLTLTQIADRLPIRRALFSIILAILTLARAL